MNLDAGELDSTEPVDPKARLRLIDQWLDRALDIAAAERSAFLAEHCPAEIREDVERLAASLTDDEGSGEVEGGAFQGALARQMVRDIQRRMPLEPGDTVGAFRVERELGRGGMAVVYLAERIDGAFDQQVALKVVLEPQRSPKLTARFHLERQILAGLRHPNIAQLLDGGLTEQGRPYFAMEWVDGTAINTFCDRHRLSIEQRLRLFVQVTRAVEAAHRSLIIHRDIKPSNILVALDPGEDVEQARVKLLDFGIAKVLDPDQLDEEMQLTRTSAMPMTPEYASPEQLLGEPLTTSSDLYQLGILLFQLLCGRRPFQDLSFAERIAIDHEPARPSTVLALPETETVAESRSTTRRALKKLLTGDLETIVLTALRREPENRYSSVTALGQDLEAYLEGRPIGARAAGALYRARKFIGRNRWATLTVGLLSAALATVMVISTVRLKQERDLARDALVAAESSQAESEEVAELLLGLFQVSGKGAKQAESLSALDLLDRGTRRLETDLRDRPNVRARMSATLAGVYRDLAQLSRAEELGREALSLADHLYGPYSLEKAEAMDLLGSILNQQNRLDESSELLHQALAVRESLLPADHEQIADSLNSLSAVHWQAGRYEQVEPLLLQSLEIRQRKLGLNHANTAAVHKNLCILLRTLDRLEESEGHCERAVAAYRQSLGPDDPKIAGAHNTFGLLRAAQGRPQEAETHYLEALRIWRASLGENHMNTTLALENLGGLYIRDERFEEAEALYRSSLEINESTLGENHPIIARTLQNLGLSLRLQEKWSDAETMFRRAVDIHELQGNEDHPDLARTQAALAYVRLVLGDIDSATALAERAYEIRREALGPDHPELADSMRILGSVYRGAERYDEAEPLFLDALRIRSDGKDPQKLGWIIEDYAALLRETGREAEAEELESRYPEG